MIEMHFSASLHLYENSNQVVSLHLPKTQDCISISDQIFKHPFFWFVLH